MDRNLKNFINNQRSNPIDYKRLYLKYKKKYLKAKNLINNQTGSSSFGSNHSTFKPVASTDSLSGEIIKSSSTNVKRIYPLALSADGSPISSLSENIHEYTERNVMSEEDMKKNKPISNHKILPVYIESIDQIKNDIRLTIFTIAYNLLKKIEIPTLPSSGRETFPLDKKNNCIIEFFKLAKKIIESISQMPFLKLRQREEVNNFITKCHLFDPTDFVYQLSPNKIMSLPNNNGYINYGKSISALENNIMHGLELIKTNYDKDLTGILIKLLI